MHRAYVEALLAEEETALRAAVAQEDQLLRIERRGTVLVVEARRTIYQAGRIGMTGPGVPLLGGQRYAPAFVALRCDNWDTDPPSVSFIKAWDAVEDLPYEAWPKGPGMVERHHATGKPFVCRPGTREFHTHFQHGDELMDDNYLCRW